MNLIITLLVGALIGWIASVFMKTDAQQGALANVVIGIVGSFLGSWIFGGLLGIGSAGAAGTFTLAGIFWGALGAIVLIWILKAFRVMA